MPFLSHNVNSSSHPQSHSHRPRQHNTLDSPPVFQKFPNPWFSTTTSCISRQLHSQLWQLLSHQLSGVTSKSWTGVQRIFRLGNPTTVGVMPAQTEYAKVIPAQLPLTSLRTTTQSESPWSLMVRALPSKWHSAMVTTVTLCNTSTPSQAEISSGTCPLSTAQVPAIPSTRRTSGSLLMAMESARVLVPPSNVLRTRSVPMPTTRLRRSKLGLAPRTLETCGWICVCRPSHSNVSSLGTLLTLPEESWFFQMSVSMVALTPWG